MEAVFTDKHFDLVARCKQGNKTAHFELYKLYSKSMYNVALRIVNDTDEANDVLQEAFVDAFGRIKDFRQETTFGAWIKQIVIHRAINFLRKRKAELVGLDETDVDCLANEEETDDEETEWKIERIKEAMQLLPEAYRVIFSLYLLEGYDHEEIGQVLHISVNSSRTQFLRAKRKLIEILKQKGHLK
ncbi:RNA polymerase sigma factor [Mucilaginibacter arboris]|uniref:Sigma-70 family RNA polymerase sigma factor n=1 Tax=Mucilaginibacter arboris TaxID=2682090 RepID=A0A7K1SW77_9SPHI|nr:RNA polymerase sigma factor [Mucilaginibacter arboris]MVN21320.1 sigma-70 family RNA polymerase sigma factor [Mucilaginibacter arboris]